MKQNKYIVILCALVCLMHLSCAQKVPLTGGPKDLSPPKLKAEGSTPNRQVNFQENEIHLVFDEFVIIDKPDQILISPPLPTPPKIEVKGKQVDILFEKKSPLQTNTTYIVYLGQAVKDLNEGNVLNDFDFVFSTGPTLDTFQLEAQVVGSDQKPAEGVLVMLYKDLTDSVVYKIKPSYVGRTNKSGKTVLKYIAEGTYQIIALKDNNFNFNYDLTKEQAGFYTELITIPYSGKSPKINVFERSPAIRITSIDSSAKQRIKVNVEPNTTQATLRVLQGDPAKVLKEEKSFDVYYGRSPSVLFEITRDGFTPDTFYVTNQKINNTSSYLKLETREPKSDNISGQPIELKWNAWIDQIDLAKIKAVSKTTNMAVPLQAIMDTFDKRKIKIDASFTPDSTYFIILEKGAVVDVLGTSNDSINTIIKTIDPETLGAYLLKVDSLSSQHSYIFTLTKNQTKLGNWEVTGSTTFEKEINNLMPGDYQLLIGEDINNNGIIDLGSFEKRSLPEIVYTIKLEPLRANWTVETQIDFKYIKSKDETLGN